MKREEYEERMKNEKYRALSVTTCADKKEYVCISYRGNSWEKVLTDIVYKLQKEYGLRVYFDKEFASETNIWLEQFRKNMDSKYCKACLCFFDEGYVTSYATLLELMHAMNPRSKLSGSIFPVSFPIDWENLDDADWNTGLGIKNQDNPGWEEEKEAFEYEFDLIKTRYPGVGAYYYNGAELRGCDCKDIMAIIQPRNKREYADEEAYYSQFIIDPLKKACPGVFESTVVEEKTEDKKEKEEEKAEEENTTSEPVADKTEGYHYSIFGKEYTAGAREQGKLMYDAFEALTDRYPECVEKLTQKTSVARAEDVKDAGTKEADPAYFRGCKSFEVGGQAYLVGTSYGFAAKLAEIKGMFRLCGANPGEFILDGKPLSGDDKEEMPVPVDSADPEGYVYMIFGKEYTAGSRDQGKLMYDAYEALMDHYPECAEKLTQKTSIAKAEDVKDAGTKASNPTYFRACRSFLVGGQEYLVGTSYGFDAKLAEIKGMFKLCEADFGHFVIVSSPERSTRSSNGKQGIGELL